MVTRNFIKKLFCLYINYIYFKICFTIYNSFDMIIIWTYPRISSILTMRFLTKSSYFLYCRVKLLDFNNKI